MKKISRTAIISVSLLLFAFLVCIVYGNFFYKLPELPPRAVSRYKFLVSLKVFCLIIPALLATSCNVGWCLEFGLEPGASTRRFSDSIFEKYKKVILTGLLFTFFIVLITEIALSLVSNRIKFYEQQPFLMKEFRSSAEFFFEQEEYDSALHYAKLAYSIDSQNEANRELLFKTEAMLNKEVQISATLREKMNELTFKDVPITNILEQKNIVAEPYKSYELLETAKECLKKSDWFGAHYYSQVAQKLADSKDINLSEMKRISADAWNRISETRFAGTSEEQQLFAKKYSGYVALINEEILKAYYIFHTLSVQSKKNSIDPDVVRYLEIARNALQTQYFFTDETKELQSYEDAHNVYFKTVDSDSGITTLYFMRGITSADSTGMIQYLRGLEIVKLDSSGDFRSGYYVPYAKMTALQTANFDSETRKLLGIDDSLTTVPYIMLNSVDRNIPNQMVTPEFTGGYKLQPLDGFIILKMPFYDFNLIKAASNGVEGMNLYSVFKFVNKAGQYGYSKEVFAQFMANRLFIPLYLLILFVLVAWISWHFRVDEDAVFKFKWVVMFPLLAVAYVFVYTLALCFYRFMNYGLLALTSHSAFLLVGTVFYIVLLILASLLFLSCKNNRKI